MLEFWYVTLRVNQYWYVKVSNGVVWMPDNVFSLDLSEKTLKYFEKYRYFFIVY